MVYKTEMGNASFEKYITKLSDKGDTDGLARILIFLDRLKECGLSANNKYPKTMKQLRGDIYELRPGGHRVLFFYFTGDKFVILHAFEKHSGKTPPYEIDKAEAEMKDHIRRNKNG